MKEEKENKIFIPESKRIKKNSELDIK